MQDPASAPSGSSQSQDEFDTTPASRVGTSGIVVYVVAIFVSAFLIFLVQPMVGKRILPWFGGVPAVWTLCLAFYQSVLFLGYAYAHAMVRFAKPRIQVAIHVIAIAAAFASLPVLPDLPPESLQGGDPTLRVFRLLASSVALPFLVLASTGPLVQAWFARVHPTRSPYPLYAVSNLGSLLALFVYPFALEPRLSLSATGTLWTWGFVVACVAVVACALPGLRSTREGLPTKISEDPIRNSSGRGFVDSLVWLGLSGTAVILLMGVTNKLCLDVASIPFLWIAPLATYLITFIFCFSSERAYRRGLFVSAAVASLGITWAIGPRGMIAYQVLAYCGVLVSTCMCLHGELYRLRPATHSLTRFYLCVSGGGALGGLLVGIVAPVVFDDYYELQVGLVAFGLMMLAVCARDPLSFLHLHGRRGRWRVVAPLALASIGAILWQTMRSDPFVIHKERSFFGVLSVRQISDAAGGNRTLTNGTTVHGLQLQDKNFRRVPTAYFGRATGIGLALTSRPEKGRSRIGVIGLGVGTLAAYGREGDTMRFFEIDPVVVDLAGPGGYFSFIEDSKAAVDVVVGDARLSIEAAQARGETQEFDILILDAFSSDAIPIHLMTREAYAGYFQALAPGGILAVHVSNRHFRLMNLVSRMAAEFGAHSLQIKTRPAPNLQSGLTDWVIITRDADDLTRLQIRIDKRHHSLGLAPGAILMRKGSDANLDAFPLWTDDYSDLLSVVRWN